jgi:hypothetical protein
MEMLVHFGDLAPPAHLEQDLLTVNRTTAVETAIADDNPVCPYDPTMEVPVIPQRDP